MNFGLCYMNYIVWKPDLTTNTTETLPAVALGNDNLTSMGAMFFK